MSADGEIEVSVKAEGVDDAAEELSDGDASGGGGAGGGGGDGGLRGSLRAGIVAGLVTSLAGPLLETLDPILDLLHAFLAPVAGLMLRLMQPFLRFMLTKILPMWVNWLDFGPDALENIRGAIAGLLLGGPLMIIPSLLEALDKTTNGMLSSVVSKIKSLPGDLWSKMKQLPGQIGQALARRLPNVNPLGDGGDSGGFDPTDNPVTNYGERIGTEIRLSGGLDAFVDRVETESGVDFP